jgi:hypothetical protein
VATGDYSARVHLWDVRTGARAGGPLGAGSIVLSLAFSPDGRVLAAGTAHVGNQAIAMGTVPYEVWTEAAIAHLEVGDDPHAVQEPPDRGRRADRGTLRRRRPAGEGRRLADQTARGPVAATRRGVCPAMTSPAAVVGAEPTSV